MVNTLSCGSCRICCIRFSISELDKPSMTPCPHLNPDTNGPGCTLHDQPTYNFDEWYRSAEYNGDAHPPGRPRPERCDAFVCAWRAGQLTGLVRGIDIEELRPDRSGLIVQFCNNRSRTELAVHHTTRHLYNREHLNEAGQALLAALEGAFGNTANDTAYLPNV